MSSVSIDDPGTYLLIALAAFFFFMWQVIPLSSGNFGLLLLPGRIRDLASQFVRARKAEKSAQALLEGILSPEEIRAIRHHGYLDVQSPSIPWRTYRIPREAGIVIVRERGQAMAGLCVQPTSQLPSGDIIAMHKLMIEGAEESYLSQANRLSLGSLTRFGFRLYER